MATTPKTTERPAVAEQLLTIPEVASRLGIARTSVYDFFADGRLTRHNIGTAQKPWWRVKESELAAFINSSAVPIPSKRTKRAA